MFLLIQARRFMVQGDLLEFNIMCGQSLDSRKNA